MFANCPNSKTSRDVSPKGDIIRGQVDARQFHCATASSQIRIDKLLGPVRWQGRDPSCRMGVYPRGGGVGAERWHVSAHGRLLGFS